MEVAKNSVDLNAPNWNRCPELPQSRAALLERIRVAKENRHLQLMAWQKYDKKISRDTEKNRKKGTDVGGIHRQASNNRSLKFLQSIILLDAAASGDLDEVEGLLSCGVCPDISNEDGLTALHQCCINNSAEMCRLLLRYNANPNVRDIEGWTPLHVAASCDFPGICAILISHGADLMAINADSNMPYECCYPGATLDLIESQMANKGITQEQLDKAHTLPEYQMLADMEQFYKNGGDLNQLDHQGAAPLHIAAACGYEEVTIFLLKHGARIDLLDKDKWQAIHNAACWCHPHVIEILLNYGANLLAETKQGETVFDVCDDQQIKEHLLQLKQEFEKKQYQMRESVNRTDKPKDLIRRRSSTNARSSSVRRLSVRDKKAMSWKEAKQEAEMRAGVELETAKNIIDSTAVINESSESEKHNGSRQHSSLKQRPTSQPVSGSSSQNGIPNGGSLKPPLSNRTDQPQVPNRMLSPTPNSVPVGPTRKHNDPRQSSGRSSLSNSGDSGWRPPRSDISAITAKPLTPRPLSDRDAKQYQKVIIPSTNNVTNQSPLIKPRWEATSSFIDEERKRQGSINASHNKQPRMQSLDRQQEQTRHPQPVHSGRTGSQRQKPQDGVFRPNVAVHNAYYTSPGSNSLTREDSFRNTPSHTGSVLRPERVTHVANDKRPVQATPSLTRRPNRGLIDYSTDDKTSGKCCVLM